MALDNIRAIFPDLSQDAIETSPQDDAYNCIAWAASDTQRHWWPVDFPTNGVYWPIDPPEESVDGFIAAFATLGYEVCADGAVDQSFEKLALYVDAQGVPTHMARQLPSGKWTSKIGRLLEDIEHPTCEELQSGYGNVRLFLRRSKNAN